MAAPVGVRLGYDTLTPLPGIVMTPVTLLFGPSVSYNLVTILVPGLAAYAMYRAARLWLPSRTGAIAAGAFYGYSSMLTSQAWSHIHTALGCIFLPLTLEATIRLRRRPGAASGIVLGLVVGAAVLVDQEIALLAVTIAVLGLVPWLLRNHDSRAFLALRWPRCALPWSPVRSCTQWFALAGEEARLPCWPAATLVIPRASRICSRRRRIWPASG